MTVNGLQNLFLYEDILHGRWHHHIAANAIDSAPTAIANHLANFFNTIFTIIM